MNNIVENIALMMQSSLTLLREQSRLLLLEAELAKQSIAPFIIILCACIFIALTLWLSLEFGLAYVIYLLTGQIWVALVISVLLNIIGFMVLIHYLLAYQRNMTFTQTRHHMHSMMKDIS